MAAAGKVPEQAERADNGAGAAQPARLTSSSLLARNATLNVATEGWLALVLFASIPLLVKFLGEESFGLFSLGWVVVGYLAFLDIGVSTATTRFTSLYLANEECAQIGRLVRTALAANAVLGAVAGIIAAAIAPLLIQHVFKIPASLANQALYVFMAVAFALPLLLVQGVLRATFSSYQRFDWINLVNGSVTTVQWFAMTVLAWKGFGIVTIVWVAVIARAVMVATYFILLFRLIPDVFSHFSFCWEILWRLLRFGAWVSVSQVMGPILVYLDRVMIAAIVSLPAVTIYTIPTEVFNRLGILPSCLMAALFPAFSHHSATRTEDGHMARLYNATARCLLLALLPFFACLFVEAGDILSLWMGPRFAAEASPVLQILAVGALANFLARLPYGAVQAVGRPDITGKFHLVEMPIYFALCLALIPRWGIAGAAVACTIRLSLDAILMFWAASKYCNPGMKWFPGSTRMLVVEASLIGCLFVAHLILHKIWARIGLGVAFLGLAYFGMWIFALDGNDKPAIARALPFSRQEAV